MNRHDLHRVCGYCVGQIVERMEQARRETQVALGVLEIAEEMR